MHPHRVLLKSILGYGACQALSLVIYACYSLSERVHRPSLCWDHKDHTESLNMKILKAGSTFIVFTQGPQKVCFHALPPVSCLDGLFKYLMS